MQSTFQAEPKPTISSATDTQAWFIIIMDYMRDNWEASLTIHHSVFICQLLNKKMCANFTQDVGPLYTDLIKKKRKTIYIVILPTTPLNEHMLQSKRKTGYVNLLFPIGLRCHVSFRVWLAFKKEIVHIFLDLRRGFLNFLCIRTHLKKVSLYWLLKPLWI